MSVLVTWAIEIEGSDVREILGDDFDFSELKHTQAIALAARKMAMDPESIATVYKVTDLDTGEFEIVDLYELVFKE